MSTIDDLVPPGTTLAVDEDAYIDPSDRPALLDFGRYLGYLTRAEVTKAKTSGALGFEMDLHILSTSQNGASSPIGRSLNYQRVWATRFERNGVEVSGLGDAVRSIDKTRRFVGADDRETMHNADDIFQEAITMRTPVLVSVIKRAYDKEYAEDLIAKGMKEKDARKKATASKPSQFKTADGKPTDTWTNPASGNVIDAQNEISTWLVSGTEA